MNDKTLIVIDMQNDFIYGSLGTKEAQSIVDNVKAKIKKYRDNRDPIIYTKDTHYNNYLDTKEGYKLPVEHCKYKTEGWYIVDGLMVEGSTIIEKETFGYKDWSYKNFINNSSDIIEIVGVCTDICVISNALILKAMYPNKEITVDASCCAGSTPEKHKYALEIMKSCQINVINE